MNKLVILFVVFVVLGSIEAYNKIAIEDIPYLDLYSSVLTVGTMPKVQQNCVEDGAKLCDYYQPNYIHCVNSGASRGKVIWKCDATLSRDVKFGKLDVRTL